MINNGRNVEYNYKSVKGYIKMSIRIHIMIFTTNHSLEIRIWSEWITNEFYCWLYNTKYLNLIR